MIFSECMKIVMDPGTFLVHSKFLDTDGDTDGDKGKVCGVYIASPADHVVEVEMEQVDVPCNDGGLAVVSGVFFNIKRIIYDRLY